MPTPHTARVIEVVETTLTVRGDGTEKSPSRIVTQYWSRDGKLLAENDLVNENKELAEAWQRQALRLLKALEWALGAEGEIPTRKKGDGQFWWRAELRKRAGL